MVLIMTAGLVWSAVFYYTPDNFLKIYYLDVGQGDATLVVSPSGNKVLIDAGPDMSVISELGRILPFYDRRIDLLVATHPHADHLAGFEPVLNRFSVGAYMESGSDYTTEVTEAVKATIIDNNLETKMVGRGTRIYLDGPGQGTEIRVLYPDKNVQNEKPDNASLVLQVIYGQTSFIFTGDAFWPVEEYLVWLDGPRLDNQVFQAGHHGSRTSNSPLFLGFVNPAYIVISAGLDNPYGHPHPEILEIYGSLGAEILKTYEAGTVLFKSDGNQIKVI